MSAYDVVIVGGAATGSATAYHLRRLAPRLSVLVVEPEPDYEHCSTLRSDGNVRYQFNLEENVAMSTYSFELMATFGDEMAVGGRRPRLAPRHNGNLFLTDEAGRDAAAEGLALQRRLGCPVEWLDADQIAARWPSLRTEGDVVGGTFGPRDGAIDPTALLDGFRRRAVADSATYVADRVMSIVRRGDRVTGVELEGMGTVVCDVVVLAAGAWSTPIAATADVSLPVEPVMRTVHVVEHAAVLGSVPSVFLPSGLYALPESPTRSQVAWSTDRDPVGFDFTYTSRDFESVVWPELVATLPAYDALRLAGGWCGVYAVNTLDHNAILGAWPGLDGLFVGCGYSGHGLQHTPAMGRHLAELVADVPTTMDLARLGPQRVLDGEPLREHAARII